MEVLDYMLNGRYALTFSIEDRGIEEGNLYEGYDTLIGRFVWLKFIKETEYMSDSLIPDYLDECTAIGDLEGDYLLKTYDAGKCVIGGIEYIYIVSEYKKGILLKEILRGGYLHIEGVVNIATQLVKALNILYINNLYHGNLSPSNILIDSDYNVRLLDVGLTKANNGVHIRDKVSRYFISPSQLNINYSDMYTDFYVLGVILFLSIFNKFPYELSEDGVELLANMDRGIEWHMLPTYHKVSNAQLLEIVKKLLSRADKYNSTEEILIDLSNVLYSNANISDVVEEDGKEEVKKEVLLIDSIETKLLY